MLEHPTRPNQRGAMEAPIVASKIFACFLLLLAGARANDPHWTWYPMNSVHLDGDGKAIRVESGMRFYFFSAPASTVNVSALVVDDGRIGKSPERSTQMRRERRFSSSRFALSMGSELSTWF